VTSAPDPLDVVAGLVLDNGHRWGEVATDVQQANVRAVLTPAPGDPKMHWLELPKGHSKTTDTAAASLAYLICQAPDVTEGFVAASDQEQAARLLGAARGMITRSGLTGALQVESRRILNTRTGAAVVALAADAPGTEGVLSPWIIADELPRWPTTKAAKDMWTALFSSQPKWPGGARLLVLGHSGDPAHWAYRLREKATRSARWRFVRVPGPTPWLDADDLAEQQDVLLPSEYTRRHLNVWCSGEDRLTTRTDVLACTGDHDVLEPAPGRTYLAGLDVGLTDDRCVVTVGHREGDRVVIDRQHVWQGTRDRPVSLPDVEAFLRELHLGYHRCKMIFDPYQAAHLAQRLRADGVTVTDFTFSSASVGRLAATLYRALRSRSVLLPADAELAAELVSVRLRESAPGVFRIDHDAGQHDDRVVSLAMVVQALITRPQGVLTVRRPTGTLTGVSGPGDPATAIWRRIS
jgi:phage terminase large subunit-like protein